jgi:hypothetical protein
MGFTMKYQNFPFKYRILVLAKNVYYSHIPCPSRILHKKQSHQFRSQDPGGPSLQVNNHSLNTSSTAVTEKSVKWSVAMSCRMGSEIIQNVRTDNDEPWGPPSLLYNGYWGGGASTAVIRKRVQLYFCSPSGSSWPFLECTLSFMLTVPLKKTFILQFCVH